MGKPRRRAKVQEQRYIIRHRESGATLSGDGSPTLFSNYQHIPEQYRNNEEKYKIEKVGVTVV